MGENRLHKKYNLHCELFLDDSCLSCTETVIEFQKMKVTMGWWALRRNCDLEIMPSLLKIKGNLNVYEIFHFISLLNAFF